MRVGLFSADRQVGSRDKYPRMLSRLCELTWHKAVTPEALASIEAAVVYGDSRREWQSMKAAGVPYLLIENDIASLRGTERGFEQEMVQGAAAMLLTSEDHHEYLSGAYSLPPTEVVHLRPLARDLDFEPLDKLPGRTMVYAGGLASASRVPDPFGYRAYHDVFARMISAGWQVHVYPAWNERRAREREYMELGCVIHASVPDGTMLYRELSQYSVCFHGYALGGQQDYVKTCRPNKTWLGLASGIPTVGFNTGASGAVYDGRWGVVAKSLARLPRAAARAMSMRIDPALRAEQVIDADTAKLARLIDVLQAAIPEPAPEGSITWPRRITKECRLDGVTYPKGTSIDRATALALKAAGQLKDERIR